MKSYQEEISTLRETIIYAIIDILKTNNRKTIDLPSTLYDPTFVIWFDDDCQPYECRVIHVAIQDNGLVLTGVDNDGVVYEDIDSRFCLGARNLDWLNNIYENIQDTLSTT